MRRMSKLCRKGEGGVYVSLPFIRFVKNYEGLLPILED